MDADHDQLQMEPDTKMIPTPPSKSIAFLEAAALLTVWSLLVINEGSIRLNDTKPSIQLLEAGRPSKFILFTAALSEVIFGLLGFLVGVAAFTLRWYSTAATKALMLIQTVLGYYVFVVYVFVKPIFDTVDLDMPIVPGLSLSQSRAVLVMGLLTSFHFCLALQGGQFVFMARLIVAGTHKDFLRQQNGARMRSIFWNANMAFSGLWTLITGAIVSANATESGRLSDPYISPPNVGVLPGLTVWTGLLLLLWGGVGAFLGASGMAVPKLYYFVTAYVYVSAFLNYGIVQFGLFGGPSGAVALHNGLVFMVVFMGAYFLIVSEREQDEKM